MQYWHETITQKSLTVLQRLRKKHQFVLIGGWAVWLYTKALKSKDIDIVVSFEELTKLRRKFNLFKNERLKKYEALIEEVDVDVYVPFYSNPGLPAEEILDSAAAYEGFLVPPPEILLILKQKTFQSRGMSTKGEKDKVDIFSLLTLSYFNWGKYKKYLEKYNLRNLLSELQILVKETTNIPALAINPHQFFRYKKKWLAELS
ncbi:MAG: hypothetical protein FJ044_00545 [Candidatus Cloacimonetes bacterium]|nr:hypothetical protein [Candidatus Cloacimonadota bacterium]